VTTGYSLQKNGNYFSIATEVYGKDTAAKTIEQKVNYEGKAKVKDIKLTLGDMQVDAKLYTQPEIMNEVTKEDGQTSSSVCADCRVSRAMVFTLGDHQYLVWMHNFATENGALKTVFATQDMGDAAQLAQLFKQAQKLMSRNPIIAL
jgi:hypothetical protein